MTDKFKLLPREATREMLEAMDECSMEGYDERLYEGHASSVYMAAWDAFYGQHCYCGDITSLGVIHRDDGPCHYPEHTSEYKRGYADAMNWKVQNHLEHLPTAQPEQEPVAWPMKLPWDNNPEKHPQFYTWTWDEMVGGGKWRAEYGWKKPDRQVTNLQALYTTPPQRKPLTDEQAMDAYCETPPFGTYKEAFVAGIRFIEAAHGIKE